VLKVKISMRGVSPRPDLSQFIGNDSNELDGCHFYVNDPSVTEADIWIVVEDLPEDDLTCNVKSRCAVFVSAETSWPPAFYRKGTVQEDFLKQFGSIRTCHDVYLPESENAPPFLPWMINANHGDSIFSKHSRDIHFLERLNLFDKPKELAIFCSSQVLTPNHQMRLDFVHKLKEHFGERLDWFGNGINSLPEKWEGIAPYKYSIVLENQSATNIFTEKIYDAFLGLSFPIYWGAPNLHEHFNGRGFQEINIRDLLGSIEVIERCLSSNTFENNFDALVENRDRVLNNYNLFKRIAALSNELYANSENMSREPLHLVPLYGRRPSRLRGGPRGIVSRVLKRMTNLVDER